MPNWLIKSAVQRTISWLPASHKWNELFQQYVTRSLDLTPERLQNRLDFARRHLDHFLALRPALDQGFSVLEVGTGWYPVVPVGLFLCGAGQVWTYDIAPHLSAGRLHLLLTRLQALHQAGSLVKILPRLRPERYERLCQAAANASQLPPERTLEQLNIFPQVRDAQDTGRPAGSIDLFVSTGVLEYIPRPVLQSILAECRRTGSTNAVQSHYLNLIDQYWYFDRSITPFNFLKYSSRRWQWLNSPLTWQNRLRISDFRSLFREAGYQVTHETNTSGTLEDLQKVQLAPEFQHYALPDLLVTISWLAAKPLGT